MTILVTGAYGQLGSELCRQLAPDAFPIDVDTLDLTQSHAVMEALLDLQPAAVINCAAYTQVDRAETQPEACYAVNATAVKYLARACRALDCPLVQLSTDYVFGGAADRANPYRECEPASPQGAYARSKLAGERYAAQHRKHLIVRTCGLYAAPWDHRANNFVRTMLRLGCTRSSVRVVCDQRCTPTYVPNLVKAIVFLTQQALEDEARWGTYHVTNRGETTWSEFAAEIFRQAGLEVTVEPITTAEYAAPAPRPAYSVLDTGAYHRLGGPGMPSWDEALSEYLCQRAKVPQVVEASGQ